MLRTPLCTALLYIGLFIPSVPLFAEHPPSAITPTLIHVGVLAFRGSEQANSAWQPSIEYLSKKIEGVDFKLITLDLQQMQQAVKSKSVDFILTNPGNYVDLEYRYGISRIATIQNTHYADPSASIRSSIIVRADRKDLLTLTNLEDKSLMAVSPKAFGGYQVALREMKHANIDPEHDLSEIKFVGFPQDNIVKSVLAGEVDAGIIRSCLLEKMAQDGELELRDIRVIGSELHADAECLSSSQAYPDWPIAKLTDTSDALAKTVAQALLALPETHPAAEAGRYAGWTIPVDYQSVHQLFRELKIGPYEWMNQVTLRDIGERYWQWALLLFAGIIWWLWHVYRVEVLVRVRTAQLSKSNERLKHEMVERQQAEELLRLQQDELVHVDRISIAGELASGLAHELNQPLSAISSYAQGCTLRLDNGKMSTQEFRDITQRISDQSERAAAIIQRLRTFLMKDTSACTDIDLNNAVKEAVALFASEAKRREVTVTQVLGSKLPPVCTENIQLQQVIINLLKNGADAMINSTQENRKLEIKTYTKKSDVCIAIKDTGEGILEENRRRLFDPFFTTKSDGMGLGLSLSNSIIQAHRGRIRVESHGTGGTTFIIELPIYTGESDEISE